MNIEKLFFDILNTENIKIDFNLGKKIVEYITYVAKINNINNIEIIHKSILDYILLTNRLTNISISKLFSVFTNLFISNIEYFKSDINRRTFFEKEIKKLAEFNNKQMDIQMNIPDEKDKNIEYINSGDKLSKNVEEIAKEMVNVVEEIIDTIKNNENKIDKCNEDKTDEVKKNIQDIQKTKKRGRKKKTEKEANTNEPENQLNKTV